MRSFGRRRLLQGAGLGGAWATGLFRKLVSPALGATPDARAAVFFVVGGGMETPGEYGIMPPGVSAGSHKAFEAVASVAMSTLPAKLKPLEPVRERLLVVDGLNNRIGGVTNHTAGYGTLSCALHPGSAGFGKAPPGGITIDQHLAATLGRDTPRRSLLVGFNANSLAKRLDRDADTFATAVDKPAAHIVNVALLQEEVFGGGVGGQMTGEAEGKRGRLLMDSLRQDIGRLSARLAAPERVALDEYLRLIEDHERRLMTVKPVTCAAPKPAMSGAGPEAITEVMLSTVTLALQCGVTRVVGVAIGTGTGHEDMPAHSKLHEGELDGHVERDYPRKQAAIQGFHMQQIARMSQALGDGVVITYQADTGFATFGEHHATSMRHPIIIVGSAGGRLRAGGRYLRLAKSQTALADAYCAIASALGVPTERFGSVPATPVDGGNVPSRGPATQLLA